MMRFGGAGTIRRRKPGRGASDLQKLVSENSVDIAQNMALQRDIVRESVGDLAV